MKNQDLFNKTINILVQAYQQSTLEHFNCYACAVGNIIANNMKIAYTTEVQPGQHNGSNKTLFWDMSGTHIGSNESMVFKLPWTELNEYSLSQNQIKQYRSTGYSLSELTKIEFAFEHADRGETDDDHMFNGLMNVVDALIEIHEGEPVEAVEYKSLFVLA